MNLAKRLGYRPDDKLLIINADDFGLCTSTNAGIQQLLEEQVVSSATIMTPCTGAEEALRWSAAHPRADIGVHITLTSEWDQYKWGPTTDAEEVSSLLSPTGVFPADSESVERLADNNHVRMEIINQIEKAKTFGVDVTHLDNHMGSLYGLVTGRDFVPTVFSICAEYKLPFRIPRRVPANRAAAPQVEERTKRMGEFADELGIVILDDLVGLPFQQQPGETYETCKNVAIEILKNLRPGITELYFHPSLAHEDIKAFHPFWEKRTWEMDVFRDPDVQNVLKEEGIRQIRWSDLRELQRSL